MVSSIRVKKGWKLEPSGSGNPGCSSFPCSSPSTASDRPRGVDSSKCGDGRRARPVGGFWVLVPLVLRSEDFDGEEEWDGGFLGRDILREGWGLHGALHGEVEGKDRTRSSRQTAALGWSRDHVTVDFDILLLLSARWHGGLGKMAAGGTDLCNNTSRVEVHRSLLFAVGVSFWQKHPIQPHDSFAHAMHVNTGPGCSFVALFPLEFCRRSANLSFALQRWLAHFVCTSGIGPWPNLVESRSKCNAKGKTISTYCLDDGRTVLGTM